MEAKGASDVASEVGAEPKGAVQGGCHIYEVIGAKPFEIKVMHYRGG